MAITYIASTDRPGDNSTQGGNVSSPLLIAASGATTGDLVVVIGHYRGNATIQVGAETAGQTWNSLTQFNDTSNLCAVRVFWCRWNTATYNGNNPNFEVASGSSAIAFATVGHIFRPTTSTNVWAVDNVLSNASYSAPSTPFTVSITGVTPPHASSVAIAGWFSEDDNTWGSLSGTGWTVAGDAQYRNTTGNDMSSSYAYKIQSSSAATGNVSKNQATLGGDAGATFIVSFYEASSGAYTLPITTASYSLTNNAAGVLYGRKLPISVSATVLTMNAVNLLHGYKLGISVSSYSLSYQNVGLSVQRRLSVTPASYAASGKNVGLLRTRTLSVSSSSYALSMVNVGLNFGLRMSVSPAAFTGTTNSISLRATRSLTISAASFTLTDNNAILKVGRSLPVNQLSAAFTTNNVTLSYGSLSNYSMSVSALSLTLTRNIVDLLFNRTLPVNKSSFIIVANDLQLLAGKKISISAQAINLQPKEISLLFSRLFDIGNAQYVTIGNDVTFVISNVNANRTIQLVSGMLDSVSAQSNISAEIKNTSNITQLIGNDSGIPDQLQNNSPIITTN